MEPKVIWLEGLSASGKSTIALALATLFKRQGCATACLDGDELRKSLCADLGFSAEDRHENLRRAAKLAKEYCDGGQIVIASFITPSEHDREMLREKLGPYFFEVYVETSLSTCRQRDPKGLYAKADAGLIKDFTGVSAPFEVPVQPHLVVRTDDDTALQCARQIMVRASMPKAGASFSFAACS